MPLARTTGRERDFTLYVPGYSTSPSAKPNTSLRSTIHVTRIIATILSRTGRTSFTLASPAALKRANRLLQTCDNRSPLWFRLSRPSFDPESRGLHIPAPGLSGISVFSPDGRQLGTQIIAGNF